MYKLHRKCRACEGDELDMAINLGSQPLANDFCLEADERGGLAPLEVLRCHRCGLAQLSVVVNPEVLYQNYLYVTSKTDTMQRHFQWLWEEIKKEFKHPEVLVEIGSNDGDFLKFARDRHCLVSGIDPAENLVMESRSRGFTTILGPLNNETAKTAATGLPPVDVVVARHVFCHVNDWHAFLSSIDILCNRETLVVIEVPYVKNMLEGVEFDTIYHEHLSYLSLKAMDRMLSGSVFRLHKILFTQIHGGSVVIMLRRRDHNSKATESVRLVESENITSEDWGKFQKQVESLCGDMKRLLNQEGLTYGAYGASAKSSVWLNLLPQELVRKIKFIADANPLKHGRYTPGTEILIVPEAEIVKRRPDYLICFAWNFREDITAKCHDYLAAGGQLVFPAPKFEIV